MKINQPSDNNNKITVDIKNQVPNSTEPIQNPIAAIQVQNTNPDENISIRPNQIDYSKITNIDQIKHISIFQKDNHTFYITEPCCLKALPLIQLIFVLTVVLIEVLFNIETILRIFIAIGYSGIFIGGIIEVLSIHTVEFILGDNYIQIIRKGWLRKYGENYLIDQLIKIELAIEENSCAKNYSVKVYMLAHPDSIKIYEKSPKYTDEEIGYFNYIMERHIANRRNIS